MIIELAKQKGILTFMGYVKNDIELPINPKDGDMYIATTNWKSMIINDEIFNDDTLIYSKKYGWSITRSASSIN